MMDYKIRNSAISSFVMAFFCIAVLPNVVSAQKTRFVEIEIVASNLAPLETQQQWMKILSDVGADRVRSRSSTSGATVKVTETETSAVIRVKVAGAIKDRKLILPGQSFSIRDKERIRDYVKQLKADGADVALAEKKAFGLTSQQLVDVNTALSAKLEMNTKGQTASEVFRKIRSKLTMPIRLDIVAKSALEREEVILDELNGFSIGTALAAIARPLGLVISPKRKGQTISLHIVDYKSVEEHWPIGWPAPAIPKKMLPSLFDKFPIEVREFPLDQVLNAIQTRSKVTMLFDYNSMAKAGIELAETNVTFAKKSSYAHALGKVLNQTKPRMDYEIRVDENGLAFLWISTANPVK